MRAHIEETQDKIKKGLKFIHINQIGYLLGLSMTLLLVTAQVTAC